MLSTMMLQSQDTNWQIRDLSPLIAVRANGTTGN
jgi:hypothetical protein